MIIEHDFIWLCSRSEAVFWGMMKGGSPNEAVRNLNWMQRALHAYAKRNHGNGKPDEIQYRGLALIAEMHRRLWDAFSKRECHRYQVTEKDTFEKLWQCAKHGSKNTCKAMFEGWIRANSY